MSKSKFHVITGGMKRFVFTKKQLEEIRKSDTKYTLSFKKHLWLYKYFENSDDLEVIRNMKRYFKFFNLSIQVVDNEGISLPNFNIKLEYFCDNDFQELQFLSCQNKYKNKLPSGKYRITVSKKIFFFFTKKVVDSFKLSKNLNKTYIL